MSISAKPKRLSKKQTLTIIFIPIIVALFSVCIYQFNTLHSLKAYIFFGGISVIINLIFTSCITFINREEYLKTYGSSTVAITSILTLIIPFFTYFILLSFIFSGFKFPFAY